MPWLLAAALAAAAPASAQQAPTAYDRAIAAGYKALTMCSGLFNAGREQAQIEATELNGIYPEYDALVPTLASEVDAGRKMVAVPFDDALPPRIAAWRPNLGCVQLPIGAGADALAALPRFDAAAPALDREPWPLGDKDASARPTGDRKRLRQSVDAAFDGASHGEANLTTGVIVVQRGRIIAEKYRQGFGPHVSQRTWSVAKSIAGTVVGVAVGEGLIDPAQPAPVPQWQTPGDPRAAITTDQLLRMASGLHSSTAGNRTDALYFGGAAVSEETVAWPLEAPPGTRFRYANNDIVLAMLGLRTRAGDDARALAFPFAALLWKIGMTRTVPETDWKGNYVMSSQVWTTARDLARFGLLYQQDGVFLGERILPQGWAKYVATPSGPQPGGDFGYGATFWLMNNSPGVPADTYAAFGNRGQYVVIVPGQEIVIVRRGEDPSGKRFDIAKFTADVLAALR
ncbi:serine hydrolase [Pseudoxanthomonas wuyuanensis]|nr:serine hydrolase [Pseudoxanthomonas wuyuanensis]